MLRMSSENGSLWESRYKVWSDVGSVDRSLRNGRVNDVFGNDISLLGILFPDEFGSGHFHALDSFTHVSLVVS